MPRSKARRRIARLGLERAVVAEVLPQPERERGQLEAAASAAAVGHLLVAVLGRDVRLHELHAPGLTYASSRGGRPNSGNSRVGVEEEGQLADLPPCELDHLERPRLIAPAGLRSACTARTPAAPLAVSTGIRREPWHPMPGPNHQVKMSSRPASQRSNGGIDCDRVLSGSPRSARRCRRPRTPPRSAPAADAARRPSQRTASLGAALGLVERRPGALERAVDRGHARLQELGGLGRLPAQHLAEDQRRALAGRQVLKRRDEGEPDASRAPRPRPPGRLGRRAPSGSARSSVTSGSVCRFASIGSLRRAEVHRPRAPLAAFEHVQADVGGDPVEPGAQRRPALEAVEAAPGADQRLLHRVLGLERGPEHPIAVPGAAPAGAVRAPAPRPLSSWKSSPPRGSSYAPRLEGEDHGLARRLRGGEPKRLAEE